jgi:tetratricopeptide (TPR) repeat protein
MSEELTNRGGNFEEAVGRFEQMLKEQATIFFDLEVIEHILEYYLDNNKLDKALLACNHAIELYPFAMDMQVEKAKILRDLGQYDAAFVCIEGAEKMQPFNPELKFIKATLLQFRQEYQKALDYYLEIFDSYDDRSELCYHIGCTYYQLKLLPDAFRYLKKALQLNPNEPLILNALLDSCVTTDDGKNLVAILEKMIDASPYQKQLWYYLGIVYNELRQFDDALHALDYAVVIDDKYSEAYFAIGHVYMNIKNYQQSYENYKIAWSIDKNSTEITCHLAASLEKLAMYDLALGYYRKATQLNSLCADGWFGMGSCLMHKEKWYESIHFFRRAVKIAPDNADYWVALAESEYKTGNIVSSIEAYKKASVLEPQQADVWLNWSFIYYEQGDNDAAIDLIMEGLDELPDHSEMLYRIVCYLIAGGQYKEAIKFLELALALNYEQHKILFEFFPRVETQKALQKLINQFRE